MMKKAGKKREPMSNTTLLMLISIVVFFVLYTIAVQAFPKGNFGKPKTFVDILNGVAPLIIIGCALTIVMIGGGINISVGGVIGLTAMSCVLLMNSGLVPDGPKNIYATLGLALGIGLAFGLLQGFMVSYLKIQPFIVTLAGMVLARGLTTVQAKQSVDIASKAFITFKKTKIDLTFLATKTKSGGVSMPKLELGVVIALGILVVVFLMLRYTKFGRNIYAIGGNEQSAMMLGINVKLNRFFSYVVSGLLSGIAGFVYLMHNSGVNATSVAIRSEMDAIASSIIGGTLLTGGVGNVIGTLFGVLILTMIENIIPYSNVSGSAEAQADIQNIANGAVLGIFIVVQSVVLSSRGKLHPIKWIKADGDKSKMARRLLLVGAIACWLEAIIGKLSGQYLTPAVTMALSGVCVIAYVVILANEANAKSVRDMLAAFMAEKEGLVEEPEQPEKVLCEPKAAVKLQKEKQDS